MRKWMQKRLAPWLLCATMIVNRTGIPVYATAHAYVESAEAGGIVEAGSWNPFWMFIIGLIVIIIVLGVFVFLDTKKKNQDDDF